MYDWDAWNESGSTNRAALFKVFYYDRSEAAESNIRFANYPYTDEVNDEFYFDTVLEVPTIFYGSRSAESDFSNFGIGTIVVSNATGLYDDLSVDSFYERTIEIYLGDPDRSFDDFQLRFKGVIESVVFSQDKTISFEIRDLSSRLDRAVQRSRFNTTNTPGVHITASDKYRPIAFGRCRQVPLVAIDPAGNNYFVSEGAVSNIFSPRANGVDIVPTSEDETISSMVVPEQDGEIVTDVDGNSEGGYITRPGAIIERFLTMSHEAPDEPILQSSDIDTASLDQLDLDAPISSSIYFGIDRVTAREAVSRMLPIGFVYGFDQNGLFFAKVLKDPSSETAVNTLTEINIFDDDDFEDGGVVVIDQEPPAWRVTINYDRNYQPTRQIEEAALNDARAYFEKDYRDTDSIEDSSVRVADKGARELVLNYSAYTNITGTGNELERVFDLFKVPRRVYQVKAWAKPLSFDIGDVIAVTFPSHGLDAGKNLVFIGADYQLDSPIVTAYFWG